MTKRVMLISLDLAWDLNVITWESKNNGLLNTMTDLHPYVLEKLDEEEAIEGDVLELFGMQKPNRTEVNKAIRLLEKLHDETLVSHTQSS